MRARSQIQRTLSEPAAFERLAGILARETFVSRRAVGRRVCAEFGFQDQRGQWQVSTCLQALGVLAERSERIALPPAGASVPGGGQPAQLADGVGLVAQIPERLEDVRELALVPVAEPEQRRIWNTLIAREHRQGLTTFAGAQMRYLVGSAEGWLGALGFAAPALRLAARERWIGWSDAQRRAHLDLVVGLSRFLVRGGCANLASHVLGRALRRLPGDFQERYGYRPWLVETFVAADQDGASLRAANFVRIGTTAGRGRQDRENRQEAGVKAIYMYALRPDWRRRLGVPPVAAAPRLEPGEGLSSATWAAQEFGGADLGDRRLTARLVRSAELLAEYPGRAISAAARGDAAAVDGYYRLIEQPTESAVTPANILAPHRERSLQRMRGQELVLCIQDGSDLNFATRPGCTGLEVIGRNQTGTGTLGLHLHLTLATTPEGLPLGVLRCGFGPADPERGGKSRRWLDGYRDLAAATRELTRRTRLVSVMDREADFFALFDEQRRCGRVDLLVRAQHDRRLEDPDRKLFAALAAGPAAGCLEIEIEGLTARPKASGRKARPARQKRWAVCELRFRRLTLPPTRRGLEPVSLWGVHLVEVDPPPEEEAVQWRLLTSLAVEDADAAAKIVGHYLQRWRIEDYFRVLKSGCRVEHLAFRTADRLHRAIAINSVIAWRLMAMTRLGRQVPDCAAELLFTDHELRFLGTYAREFRQPEPERLGPAVRLVAHLGGYRGRKHDPEPGDQLMWKGYDTLTKSTLGHRLAVKEAQRQARES